MLRLPWSRDILRGARFYLRVSPPRLKLGRTYATGASLLPKLPKRVPTKQELLASADGLIGRTKVRLRWLLTRSNRPFRTDDYVAFFSWLIWGHLVWIIVGTTTFFSLAIAAINSVSAQEFLARRVGEYLTRSSGITIVFESAIVPQWKSGCISFRNIFVSRRPRKMSLPKGVTQGSLAVATAEAAAKLSPLPSILPEGDIQTPINEAEEDTNYTQFDLTIEEVNVVLSFMQWWSGKGLLKELELKGVRGVIDRTSVHWDESLLQRDPLSWRYEPQYGDFEISSFKLEDLLVTVHQPDGFRPFTASIYSCDLPRLRKRFLFYDLLNANHLSGSYDDSLVTLHPKQSFSAKGDVRESRFRMDALAIDHINKGVEGPMGWIVEGTCDVLADLRFPSEPTNDGARIVEEVLSNITGAAPHPPDASAVSIDVSFRLNDAKAHVPLVQNDLSSINSALVRPIVGFINSRRTFIPIHTEVVLPLDNFTGSWTWFDCGLHTSVSIGLYNGFVDSLHERARTRRRMKAVGFWSLQMVAQLVLVGMRNLVPST
ncbi:Mitochondrial distribution and morphology protein 31, mitochondrial precursor [Savitreella phatthalungensis]